MKKLTLQAAAGFLFLLLVMGLALFVPAGSLSYWQGWAYLADFGLCTMLITLYLYRNDPELLARRVKGGPAVETRRSQQVIQSLASLCFIAMFIVPGLDYRFGWSVVPAGISLAGLVLVALGFTIVFLVFRENSYTSATIEVAAEQRVISSGPYRLVRHPMYAGAALLLLSTPLALGSWAALPLAVPLLLVIAARLKDEEKYLAAALAGYQDYSQKVRYRLIPFVW